MPAAAADDGKALNPDVAASLSRLGMTFVVGTYQQISPSSKSSVPPADLAIIGDQAKTLVDQYQTRVKEGAFAANLLHTTLEVAITSGQVMGSATVAAAAPTAAVAAVARYSNDKLRDFIVDDAVASASAVLSKGIDAMTQRDRASFEQLLSQGNFVGAADQFQQSTGKLSTIKDSLGGDAKAQALLDKAIQQALAAGTSEAIKQAGAAHEQVADLEKDFADHVKGMEAFTAEAADQFKALNDGVKDINGRLHDVTGRLASVEQSQATTERQVSQIQDILFDQQPPSVKLALLDSGAKSTLTGDQRSALRDVLKTQVEQQQIINTASTVVGYAKTAETILSKFGISNPEVGKAVEVGGVAVAALSQVFSGNILGAIGSIGGLFGGGPDPITLEFQQVFQQLAQLDQKLDDVIKLQQETLQSIEDLSKQLAVVEEHLQGRFDRVDFELARLNAGVERAIWRDIAGCQSAFDEHDNPEKGQYDEQAKRFTSFAAMQAYTNSFGNRAFTCQTTLVDLYSGMRNQDFSGNPLSLDLVSNALGNTAGVPGDVQNGEYGKTALERYHTDLYQPSFDLLSLSWAAHQAVNPGWGTLATAYALLATPSASAADLRSRIGFLNGTSGSSPLRPCTVKDSFVGTRMKVYLCTDGSQFDEARDGGNDVQAMQTATAYLATPIVRDQVSELTKYAAFVAGPSDLAKGASSPGARTLDEIVKDNRVSLGREVLTGALMVSDVSIAQQAMIYGDLTAWFVAEQLWDPAAKRFRSQPATAADKERFDRAKQLLTNANNPWLERNVLMIILQSAEKPCRAGASAACASRRLLYELAYDRFFPSSGDGAKAKLVDPDADTVTAAKNWLLGLFDINPDVTFATSDSLGGQPVPRRVLLQLDGYALPMPTPADWSTKAMVYPPLMQERLADSVVLAQRLADYTVFDGLDDTTRTSLVTIASKGDQ